MEVGVSWEADGEALLLFPVLGDAGLCGLPLSLAGGGSGTVGVLTGITGVLMGIGPRLLEPRHRLGFEDGARRMVAMPGVGKMEPPGDGSPCPEVAAGRLAGNIRR